MSISSFDYVRLPPLCPPRPIASEKIKEEDVVQMLRKSLIGVTNLDLTSEVILQYLEILHKFLLSNDNNKMLRVFREENLIRLFFRSAPQWLKYTNLSEEILSIIIDFIRIIENNNISIQRWLFRNKGISFCTNAMKEQMSSSKVLRLALEIIAFVMEFSQPRKGNEGNVSARSNIATSQFSLRSSHEYTGQANVLSLATVDATQQLLHSGMGYMLPRVLEIATSRYDESILIRLLPCFDCLVDNTPSSYIFSIISHDRWSAMQSFYVILKQSSIEIKLQLLSVFIKYVMCIRFLENCY